MAPATQAVKFTRPTGSAMLFAKNATTWNEHEKTSGEISNKTTWSLMWLGLFFF